MVQVQPPFHLTPLEVMQRTRRANYNSGQDFVLEYGPLRFTFNENDFAERCEQAAIKLGFLGSRLKEDELEVVYLPLEGTFCYVQPDRPAEPIELSPEPSWRRVAYER